LSINNSDLNIISIILGRRGSKGLKNKNIIDLCGKPLIYYTIEASKMSKYISRTIVSTDCEKTKEISLSYGAEVPFIRPKGISDDLATSEDALKHAVDWLEKNENYYPDIIVYLQITDPFRKNGMIDRCIEKLINNPKLDSVFMGLVKHKNYWSNVNGKYERFADDVDPGQPRQIKEPVFREDTGIALATKVKVIKKGRRIGKNIEIIPYEQNVDFIDIHNEFDLWLSKILMNKRNIYPNEEM